MIMRYIKCFFSWNFLAVALLLAQCLLLYGNTTRDDAFFTYWPAKTLADHGSILNYNSEHVEQSSTVFYTALLAITHKALPFIAIPTLSWMLSLLSGVMALLAFSHILKERHINTAATLILATASPMVFWSSSGMETLVAASLLAVILLFTVKENLTRHHYALLVFSCVAATLNRPEAFIILLCFSITAWPLQWLLSSPKKQVNHKTWWLIIFSTTATAALAFLCRHIYFHDWFPQPVSAKHNQNTLSNFLNGIHYLIRGGNAFTTQAITVSGLIAGTLALFYKTHTFRLAILTGWFLVLSQIAFILATGGDWMDASRFLLPVIPALLLCCILFLAPWPRLLFFTVLLATLFSLYDSWHFAQTQSTGFSINERESAKNNFLPTSIANHADYSAAELQSKDALRDIPQLEHLKTLIKKLDKFPEKIQIASIQMGFIPYHLASTFPNRLHFLDLRGLSTQDLTLCPLLKTFPRTDKGINISYDQFFGLLPSLTRQCNIQKPDILYDLGYDMRQQVLQDNDYIITYREQRHIRGEFSSRAIGSELFVAIRKELAAQFNIPDINGIIPTTEITGQHTRPNIVFLIADDVSYDNFGFMGSTSAKTPSLDQLAQQGTVFTTAYVPTSFCRPSLATLLTGQWPHQHLVYANNGVIALPPGYPTLATYLQKAGYVNFSGGKFWEDEPNLRGFDRYDTRKEDFVRKDQDKLWQFLDEFAGKQPMFIWWAPMIPHRPHNPPQQYLDAIDERTIDAHTLPADKQQAFRESEKRLLATNLWFDAEYNKVRKVLADKKQLDNTVFIFMADNGFSNRGASKSSPYELGLRTPVIFNWPGHIPAQRIDAGMDTVDIFRTILDIADAKQPQEALPSHSLWPVIQQKTPPVAEKLFGADYPAFTMKTDPLPRPERDLFSLHVRDGDWKYVFYLRDIQEKDNLDLTIQKGVMPFPERKGGDEELFYLPNDPYETNNLANTNENKQRVEQYRQDVLHWWYSTGGKPFDVARHCPETPTVLCQKLTITSPNHTK